MRYVVPQFLETEQRIFGPFTFGNFIILIGVGGVSFTLLFLLNVVVWGVISFLLFIGAVALMLYRPYGRPLSEVVVDFAKHLLGTRRYLWQGREQQEKASEFMMAPLGEIRPEQKDVFAGVSKFSPEKLEELSRKLDG